MTPNSAFPRPRRPELEIFVSYISSDLRNIPTPASLYLTFTFRADFGRGWGRVVVIRLRLSPTTLPPKILSPHLGAWPPISLILTQTQVAEYSYRMIQVDSSPIIWAPTPPATNELVNAVDLFQVRVRLIWSSAFSLNERKAESDDWTESSSLQPKGNRFPYFRNISVYLSRFRFINGFLNQSDFFTFIIVFAIFDLYMYEHMYHTNLLLGLNIGN
jgi:hypothetical protein